MRIFLLTLLFIRFGLISFPTIARWTNILPNSSIELRYDLDTTGLNAKGSKSATTEPFTLAPRASPAQILPTGSSDLYPNASGGIKPYQNLSVIGSGTITPGLGFATVSNLPTGIHTFTLTVTDANSQTATGTVSITVNAVNTPPTTTGIPNQTASVGQSFSLNLATFFSDAETPNSLSYTATDLPAGLSLTGSIITGHPTAIGMSVVTITALDLGNLATFAQFKLNVVAATIEPLTLVPRAIPAQILPTGRSDLTPNASGGYTPYQSLTVVGPGTIWPGLGFASVENLPTGVNTFTLTVTDFAGQMASASVSVTVTSVNTAPTTTGIPNQTASVGQSFSLNLATFFSDAETPYSLSLSVVGLPNNLSFVSANNITGVPSTTVGSPYNETVQANDPLGLAVETSFQLDISPALSCNNMYSLKAGNWNDVSVWSCGRLPTVTDVVTLNHTVTLPTSYQGLALQMIYSSNGNLIMETNSWLQLGIN